MNLQSIIKAYQESTKGTWTIGKQSCVARCGDTTFQPATISADFEQIKRMAADAELWVLLRNELPNLIQYIRTLEEACEEAKQELYLVGQKSMPKEVYSHLQAIVGIFPQLEHE